MTIDFIDLLIWISWKIEVWKYDQFDLQYVKLCTDLVFKYYSIYAAAYYIKAIIQSIINYYVILDKHLNIYLSNISIYVKLKVSIGHMESLSLVMFT